jgi:cell division GTPase FtsZ
LVNITGGLELSLNGIQEAASYIYDSAHEDVHLIFGAVIDPDIGDEVRVTVIATGFNDQKEKVDLPQIKKWIPIKQPGQRSEKSCRRIWSACDADVVRRISCHAEDLIDLPTLRKGIEQPQKEL